MRTVTLACILMASTTAAADVNRGERVWTLDRDRAADARGVVSLEIDPDARGGDITVYTSNPSISIHAIEVVYPDRRVIELDGRGGRRLELGLIGDAERLDVHYVNRRPSRDDTVTVAAQRDVDAEYDEWYDERIFGGDYDDV
jgi:hypothetical protein